MDFFLIDDVKRVKSRETEIAREKYRMGESNRVKLWLNFTFFSGMSGTAR